MKNDQTSKVDMGSFTWITGMAITFVLFAYFGWNFFVAAALSALVSELFIKSALTRKIANDENVPKLIAVANREWWLIVCLITVPVLCILMSAPGRRLSGGDYIWGELIIVIALARAGWIDLNYDRKLRAVMLFLSCIGWILLAIPRNEIATAILLFFILGLTTIAFLWSFADSFSIQERSNGSIKNTHQINCNFKTRPLLIAAGASLMMQLVAMCVDNTVGLYETMLIASLCLSQSVHILAGGLYSFLCAREDPVSIGVGAVGGAAVSALARLIFSPVTFLMILGLPYTLGRTIDEIYPGLNSINIAILGLVGIAVVVLTAAVLGAVGGAIVAAITKRKNAL